MTVDVRGAFFIAFCALVGGALAAGLPVMMSVNRRLAHTQECRQSVVSRRTQTQVAMLVVQGALSVLLLVGAGLFVRSLVALQQTDLGLERDKLLSVGLAPGERPLPVDLRDRLQEQITDRRGRRDNHGDRHDAVRFELGNPPCGPWTTKTPNRGVGWSLRPRSGLEILRNGRNISPRRPRLQRYGPPRLTARRHRQRVDGATVLAGRVDCGEMPAGWHRQSSLLDDRRRCRKHSPQQRRRRRDASLLPASRSGAAAVRRSGTRLLVRTADDDEATKAAIGERIRREALLLEPSLRYVGVQPLSAIIAPQLRSWRLGATLFGALGLLALIVAAVGLYSVIAFDVQGRQRESAFAQRSARPRARS